MRLFAISLIRLYQLLISPLLGPSCRFSPTCSTYAVTCIERFGVGRGVLLAIRRLTKCHPLGPHGYDPPPSRDCDSCTSGLRKA
ncbi:MAG: membrane protein insertion efficiency factor YidD [Deltaproteobacteria bacterium]|nr:membrane protein insertion efficiency factor YidD [Deltaproteobacteria bacterium]